MSRNNNNGSAPASTLKQVKEVAGLFSCLLEHKVVATKAVTTWDGPKIPEEVWHQMLAFFQWTYDTTHSESQVRLYVNAQRKTWAVWAYPQEAQTGMSARELDTPEAKEQRKQFSDSEGWLYFGTVHHHCGCSAFQSGTDEANEKNQDGLHITVGNMNEKSYSLHERFYLGGQKINHQLDWFWDIGSALDEVPKWARDMLPGDIKDRLARGQMIQKAPKDTKFPKVWKENLIEKKVEVGRVYVGGLGYAAQDFHANSTVKFQRRVTNLPFDLREAREQFKKLCEGHKIGEVAALQFIDEVFKDEFLTELIDLVYRNDVQIKKLCEFVADDIIGDTGAAPTPHEAAKELMQSEGGIPDYEGGQTDFGKGQLPE